MAAGCRRHAAGPGPAVCPGPSPGCVSCRSTAFQQLAVFLACRTDTSGRPAPDDRRQQRHTSSNAGEAQLETTLLLLLSVLAAWLQEWSHATLTGALTAENAVASDFCSCSVSWPSVNWYTSRRVGAVADILLAAACRSPRLQGDSSTAAAQDGRVISKHLVQSMMPMDQVFVLHTLLARRHGLYCGCWYGRNGCKCAGCFFAVHVPRCSADSVAAARPLPPLAPAKCWGSCAAAEPPTVRAVFLMTSAAVASPRKRLQTHSTHPQGS